MAAKEKFGPVFVEKERKTTTISAPPTAAPAESTVRVEAVPAPAPETVLVPKKRALLVAVDPTPAPAETPPTKRRIEISPTTDEPVGSNLDSEMMNENN
jgi:hypothetical protein